MSRSLARGFSAAVIAMGIALVVMGVLYGRSGSDGYRAMVSLTLVGGFVLLFLLTLVSYRFAEDGYRTLFTVLFLLLSVGLGLLCAFLGLMWAMLSEYAFGITLAVMLISYGAAVVMAGAANLVLSRRGYRLYIHDFLRQLPYIYYRYRT